MHHNKSSEKPLFSIKSGETLYFPIENYVKYPDTMAQPI
jgi:hypothetical protein